jgi:hypothetical protein
VHRCPPFAEGQLLCFRSSSAYLWEKKGRGEQAGERGEPERLRESLKKKKKYTRTAAKETKSGGMATSGSYRAQLSSPQTSIQKHKREHARKKKMRGLRKDNAIDEDTNTEEKTVK